MTRKQDAVDCDLASGFARHAPRQLFLELSARCNLKCVHCPRDYGLPNPELGDMPLELVRALVPWLEQAWSVNINGLGESTLHPRFGEILGLLAPLAGRVHFNTNGLLLDERLCARIAELGLGSVVISIDGVASNAAIRGVPYQLLRERVARLASARAAAGTGRPEIGVAWTLLRANAAELLPALDELLPLGIDALHLQPLIEFWQTMRGQNPYGLDGIEALLQEVERRCAAGGARCKVFRSSFAADEHKREPGASGPQMGPHSHELGCADPFYEIKVLANGNVLACSFGVEIGRLEPPYDLERVWNGPAMQALRARLAARRFEGRCERCPLVFGCGANQDYAPAGAQHSQAGRFAAGLGAQPAT